MQDFFLSALACIVKNVLLKTLHLQGQEKTINDFTIGEVVMPKRFNAKKDVIREHVKETLEADCRGCVALAAMESGLLYSYYNCTANIRHFSLLHCDSQHQAAAEKRVG
ncbi:unnamed protein product [Amaranthus hypochondriacus]